MPTAKDIMDMIDVRKRQLIDQLLTQEGDIQSQIKELGLIRNRIQEELSKEESKLKELSK